MPDDLGLSVTRRVSQRLNPWRAKRTPSVTMKLGSRDVTTMTPLSTPMATAMTSDTSMATATGHPAWTENRAVNIPVVPTMTPDERSNSPPIINRATASADTPSSAAVSTYVFVPCHDNQASPACQANRANTTIAPVSAPNSGRIIRRISGERRASRSSVAALGITGTVAVGHRPFFREQGEGTVPSPSSELVSENLRRSARAPARRSRR